MSLFWHLAIESSGLGGSVALFQYDSHTQGKLHSQQILAANRGSVQTLAPAIDQLLRHAQIHVSNLSSLSVTCGPGSFTGLRVGLATAKMLAWTARIPVVPVDTLAAIAWRFAQSTSGHEQTLPPRYRLVTAINAFRKQVFTSSWRFSENRLQCVVPSAVVDADRWLADPWQAELQPAELQQVASGPSGQSGSVLDAGQVAGDLWVSGAAIHSYPGLDPARMRFADSQWWHPLAEQVGQLGLAGLAEGRAVSAQQLMPNYIRASAAEEKADKVRPG